METFGIAVAVLGAGMAAEVARRAALGRRLARDLRAGAGIALRPVVAGVARPGAHPRPVSEG